MHLLPFNLLIICVFASQVAFSQSHISGTVTEHAGLPLAFVNVLLLQAKDSSLVKGTITNNGGSYSFENVNKDTYLIKAFMIGYKPAFSSIIVAGPNIRVPAIELIHDAKALDEVTVEALRPLYEQQIDRLIINVQSSITAAGATALEVLERSPGIRLDRQNSLLSMNGKNGVQVMVNGKLSRLPLSAIIQMLQGMPAGNIEKIELITTPSAQYDAEGNAGMINIILKKNTAFGTNGSISTTIGYGWYGKSGTSLNLNSRTEKLNIFGDYSASYNHDWNELGNIRTVINQGISTQTQSASSSPSTNVYHAPRLGFDYTMRPNTTVGGIISASYYKQDIDATNTITIQEGQKLPTLIDQKTLETSQWRHVMGNLNVRHTIKEKQEVSLDLDYLLYHNASPAAYYIDYQFLETKEHKQDEIKINKTTPIRIGVAKADYIYKISDNTKLEVGAKGTFSRIDNEVVVDKLSPEGWNRDSFFSQQIDMAENIIASFANLNFPISAKTTLQAGLRWEHTYTNINSPDQKNLVLRNYHNLFPSIFLSRAFNQDNSIQFSYSRRINRPTYNNLVPFVSFKDPYSFWSGNSNLKPTLTNAVQASYQLKKRYFFSLQASQDKNAINWMVRLDPETNQQNVYIANVDRTNTYSLNLILPVTIGSWWQMQHTLAGIWQQNNTLYEGTRLKRNGHYGNINSTHNFKLPANFNLELTGYYQSKALFGIFQQTSMGSLSLGIQKKLEKERGKFNLSISDIFWTNRFRIKLTYPTVNLNQTFYNIHEPRVVRLTYSRNFGNKNVKAATKRKTGSEDERSRIGN